MKIFNWVHRRLIPKDGLDQNVKKGEQSLTNDHADTEALLKNVVPPDMLHFHGWGGAGILSIGTFGLKDDFSINEHNKDYFSLIGKEEDMESEDEQSDDDDDDGCNDDTNSAKGDHEEEWNPLVHDKSGAPRPNAIVTTVIDAKLLSPNNLLLELQDYSYSRHNYHRHNNINDNKKERITLADLFSADSDDENYGTTKKPNYGKTQCTKKPASDRGAAKNATLFAAKKLIPRVKEDSRPIQKLHELMKRMLKRKIHPDVVEGKIKPCTAGNGIPSAQFGTNESVSLLQSRDAPSEL